MINTKKTMRPKIFVGSSSESLELAITVQQLLSPFYDVKVWNQGRFPVGQSFIDSLVRELSNVHFAIFVSNDDDFIQSRDISTYGTRDNVVMEIGMSIGMLGSDRTFIVYDTSKKTKIPSDLAGISLADYRLQDDEDLAASLAPACLKIRNAIKRFTDFRTQKELRETEIANLKQQIRITEIPGKRLFTYKNYYPIKLDENNMPSIDEEIYVRAIHYFLKDENNDRLAAMDLIYLRENNMAELDEFLSPEELMYYQSLIEKYGIDADSFSKDISLKNYIKVINDLGDTFKDVYAEFILHNVRNPIRSIVAARNTEKISGRKIGDPSTRFVYQYVVHQGKTLMKSMEDGSKVAYLKQFGENKQVKATTIPIHDPKFGLIGIICINIDIDAINHLDSLQRIEFFENYVLNSGYTPNFERSQYDPVKN